MPAWGGRRARAGSPKAWPGRGASCPADMGSHGVRLSTEAMLPTWDLRETHQAGPPGRLSKDPGLRAAGRAWQRGDARRTLAFPPDPRLPPLLAEGLLHPSAASGRVRVSVHGCPAAPGLQRQRQGQPVWDQRHCPLPQPRRGSLQFLLLPLLPMLLQRRLPAACGWALHRECRGRAWGLVLCSTWGLFSG